MTLEETLAALRKHRDEFAAAHGYDPVAMGATLREMDRQAVAAGRRVVVRQPRPPVSTALGTTHSQPPDENPEVPFVPGESGT
jgi:hypothetical protein